MNSLPIPPTPRLFYGPFAERESLRDAGRILGVGVQRPGKDDAREIVELLRSVTLCRERETVVFGPADEFSPAVGDVLLKTLEEPTPGGPHAHLFAYDLGGVSPTIRSRCIPVWCPGDDTRYDGERVRAGKLVGYVRSGDWASVVETLKEGDLEGLLRAVELELARELSEGDPRASDCYEAIRPLFMNGAPLTAIRVLNALLTTLDS